MYPGGLYHAQLRREARDREAAMLVTPPHLTPGTPDPATPPTRHSRHEQPGTPLTRPRTWVGNPARLIAQEPEFVFAFGYKLDKSQKCQNMMSYNSKSS